MIIDANTFFGFYPKENIDVSLSTLLHIVKEHKIHKILTLSLKGVFYDFEEGNIETLKYAKENPSIIPVATVDLRKYYGEEKVIKEISQSRFKMIRLFPDYQFWPIDYQPFYILIALIEKYNIPLMVNINSLGQITKISQIVKKSKIPVICAQVDYFCFAEALTVLKQNKNLYIESSFFDTPDAYSIFSREIGAERIIFGSRIPYHYFSSSWLCLERSDLKNREKELIAGKNIFNILNLKK